MNVPFSELWTDKILYFYSAAAIGGVVFLIYSIRRWLELANATPYESGPEVLPEPLRAEDVVEDLQSPEMEALILDAALEAGTAPVPEEAQEAAAAPVSEEELETAAAPAQEEEQEAAEAPVPEAEQGPAEAPAPEEAPEEAQPPQEPAARQTASREEEVPRAEDFVKGLYVNMAKFDDRLSTIEDAIGSSSGSRRFIVNSLEDILRDYETLSLPKIKTRLEYLVSELARKKGERAGRED
ncbi:MAG: hypothetical protein NTY45_14760 [Elusimicrobia bacterium]|nr:hypothetical protein [Elusimicrobiota bacterium]